MWVQELLRAAWQTTGSGNPGVFSCRYDQTPRMNYDETSNLYEDIDGADSPNQSSRWAKPKSCRWVNCTSPSTGLRRFLLILRSAFGVARGGERRQLPRLAASGETVFGQVPVMAPRGRLFDREGRLLVDNYAPVSCCILREQIKTPGDRSADDPASGLHLTVEQVKEGALKKYQSAPGYQPIP